jgi:hypothetical protein
MAKIITLTLPAEFKELGNRISRSLESDSGGYHVFDILNDAVRDEDGNILTPATIVQSVMPCCERYIGNLMQYKDDATLLHEFVSADYASRWPEHEAPTLNDCAEFLNALTIEGADDV